MPMTTERLNILAAAAALGEFTAPELAAYTGANPSTVRQVLQREQDRRKLFQRTERRPSRGGRPAIVWQLQDADAIFEEIAEEESKVAGLQGSTGRKRHQIPSTGGGSRTEVYLASAEEAVLRSFEIDEAHEQEAFAHIALNLLEAANPQTGATEEEHSEVNWWHREPRLALAPRESTQTPLETVSRVRSAGMPSFNENLAEVRESSTEFVRRRAQRVAAFAALSLRLAKALPIDLEDLARAAEAISDGSRVLPEHQTLLWIKIFVNISIKSVRVPPVAVLTTAERSPSDLFSAVRGDWRKLRIPSELADTGYVLWVEGWAESLLTSSLIPGVVISHDNSPASNEALNRVMTDPDNLVPGRAVVIASTSDDYQVVARVAASGGIYYPMLQDTLDGLLPTVRRAVAKAVNSMPPNLAVSQWAVDAARNIPEVHMGMFSRDILRAISPINIQLSDLDITHKALTALDSAIVAYRNFSGHHVSRSDLVDVFDSLSAQWPDPGQSQDAAAAVDASLGYYKRIAKIQSDFIHANDLDVVLVSGATEEARHEAREALTWAYNELKDHAEFERPASTPVPHLTPKEREVAILLANGKSPRDIASILSITNSAARKYVTSILRKLNLESQAEVADWVERIAETTR
jgi:DNA-binding CsgD family transcriptional regulator